MDAKELLQELQSMGCLLYTSQSRQYTYVISAMSHKDKQPLSVRVYPFVQE